MVEGVGVVERKVREYRPEAVCIVGKGIWDVMYKVKTGRALKKGEFEYGWQEEGLWLGRDRGNGWFRGARTFVATSTSGLAAGMKPAEKLEVWKELGEWFEPRRLESVKRKRLKAERRRSCNEYWASEEAEAEAEAEAENDGDDEYMEGYNGGLNDGLKIQAKAMMTAREEGKL